MIEIISLWDKRCSKCGEIKPLEQFCKDNRVSSGYTLYCKQCANAYERGRLKRNPRKTHPITPPEIAASITRCCAKCQEIKPLHLFTKRNTSVDGYESTCKDCRNAYMRARTKAGLHTPAKIRRNHLRTYGLTPEQYHILLDVQGGVCAVCKRPEMARDNQKNGIRRLAVDHDHATGKVRGLLCHKCNRALGLLNDDTARIQALLSYLEKSKEL